MRQCYLYIISGQDNKLLVGAAAEVLEFLDTYQNQPGKKEDFPHFYDKLVYYERFESAEEAEKRKQQVVLMDDKQKRKMIEEFNPRWESMVTRLTKEEL